MGKIVDLFVMVIEAKQSISLLQLRRTPIEQQQRQAALINNLNKQAAERKLSACCSYHLDQQIENTDSSNSHAERNSGKLQNMFCVEMRIQNRTERSGYQSRTSLSNKRRTKKNFLEVRIRNWAQSIVICYAKSEPRRNCGGNEHFASVCKRLKTASFSGAGRAANRGRVRRVSLIDEKPDKSEYSIYERGISFRSRRSINICA